MVKDGCPFTGVLYAGLMLTKDGPKVIEFNCRFGDPETQVILPVLTGDFAATLLACATGHLVEATPLTTTGAAVCVVLAADGYPDDYRKALPLRVIADRAEAVTFHAGTMLRDGKLLSSGGRVLNAVGLGESLTAARANAYALAKQLRVDGLRCRADIAERV
jgi:phosphoribosylamine--glycine ligase